MAGWVKQLQQVLRAAFAGRFRPPTDGAPAADEAAASALPRTESQATEAAARLGFTIPDPCMPGVVANLAVLGEHAGTLLGHKVGTKS